jgi:glutaredoxin
MHLHVYGYDGCPFCQKAKALLDDEGLSYTFLNVGDVREDRAAWLDSRGISGDQRTFPRVFEVDNHGEERLVGGYTELETFVVFLEAA